MEFLAKNIENKQMTSILKNYYYKKYNLMKGSVDLNGIKKIIHEIEWVKRKYSNLNFYKKIKEYNNKKNCKSKKMLTKLRILSRIHV